MRTQSGNHRVVRSGAPEPRWRLSIVLLGVAAGVAACVLAAFLVLNGVQGGDDESGQVTTSGASSDTGGAATGDRDVVPDTCNLLDRSLTDRLAPGADQTQGDAYQAGDTQNQCVWSNYTATKRRQLTLELRAIEGGADTAGQRLKEERKADEGGKNLLAGQRVTERRSVGDLGDEGYAVYVIDDGRDSGEAIVNLRTGNVLVTVHYAGTNGKRPLSSDNALEGALQTAEAAITGLNTAR